VDRHRDALSAKRRWKQHHRFRLPAGRAQCSGVKRAQGGHGNGRLHSSFSQCAGIPLERILDIFPHATGDNIPAEELLEVLLEPEDGVRIKKLCELVGEHTLLCYRVYRHWTRLRNAKKTRELIVNHRTNVDWQLRRIYRARNDVMHRGRGSSMLPRLIQHLHTYLGQTLYNLLYDLENHPGWSVPDALKHRELLYEKFVRKLELAERMPQRALLDPELILVAASRGPMWPADVGSDSVATPRRGGRPGSSSSDDPPDAPTASQS
jgi:hypothetical protein